MLAERMQAVFSRQIRGISFFGRIKQPQADCLVVQLNFGFPAIVFPAHTCVASFVVAAFLILRVFRVCSLSQIAQTVVRTVFVDVVKLLCRPRTVRVQPRQPMRGVQHVIHADANVAVAHSAPRRVARAAAPSGFAPGKFSRIRVVVDQLAESCLGKLFCTHGLHNIKQAEGRQA